MSSSFELSFIDLHFFEVLRKALICIYVEMSQVDCTCFSDACGIFRIGAVALPGCGVQKERGAIVDAVK
jgi:hypothetical protein